MGHMIEDEESKSKFVLTAPIGGEVRLSGAVFTVGTIMEKSITLIAGPNVTLKRGRKGTKPVLKET